MSRWTTAAALVGAGCVTAGLIIANNLIVLVGVGVAGVLFGLGALRSL